MRVGSYCWARSFPVVLRVYGKRSMWRVIRVCWCVFVCGFMRACVRACVSFSCVLIARPGNSMGESIREVTRSPSRRMPKEADCLFQRPRVIRP
jgi:hypothetical protein